MISLSLALELRDAGLEWQPCPGDRFVVTATEMIDELFHLADMVIETRELETGTVFAFNGTTEWALDSIPQEKTVWLPHEAQLRGALGSDFRALARTSGAEEQYSVTAVVDQGEEEFSDTKPADAYAKALLAVLKRAAP